MHADIKHSIVMIIPYFGKIPDYFNIWLHSAEANPDVTFYLYTDLPFPVSAESNVKIKPLTFPQMQNLIHRKLGSHCIINDPYKLCDYKPAYGELFSEDIAAFDFWGFCDVDLLFGDLSCFITDELLRQYDKLYDHGHFCLMRNNRKMNSLFLEEYPDVIGFNYTSRTNYCCHFDENGTIAYAPEYDASIRLFTKWQFYDAPCDNYQLIHGGREVYALWKKGKLKLCAPDVDDTEIMYIHLQKRKMFGTKKICNDQIVVLRNEFLQEAPLACLEIDPQKKSIFMDNRKKEKLKSYIQSIKTGAFKFRFFRTIHHWRTR